jgi:hypothetical protein
LVPKSLGGDDVDVNVVGLCHAHHMDLEHHPFGRQMLGPRIRASLRREEYDYIITKKGPDWLDRYYPEERRCAV